MKLSKTHFIRAQNQAAETYAKAAVLPNEVARRLIETMDMMENVQPKIILDLGCRTGFTSSLLRRRFSTATIISIDIAEQMLHLAFNSTTNIPSVNLLCGDAESLPLLSNSFDLIFSNLTLNWFDFKNVLKEAYRLLKVNGLFLFSSFGVDTLSEIRQSWKTIDHYGHVNTYIDMHDWGDELLRSQFEDPVMSMEHITLTFPSVMALLKNLKKMGYKNLAKNKLSSLLGKEHFQRFIIEYQNNYQQKDQKIPATFEIIYGCAKKLHNANIDAKGEVSIPVSSIKKYPVTTL